MKDKNFNVGGAVTKFVTATVIINGEQKDGKATRL